MLLGMEASAHFTHWSGQLVVVSMTTFVIILNQALKLQPLDGDELHTFTVQEPTKKHFKDSLPAHDQ